MRAWVPCATPPVLGVGLALFTSLGCNTAPRASASGSRESALFAEPPPPPAGSSASVASAPPAPGTTQGAAAGVSPDSAPPSRARIDWLSGTPGFVVQFPTSITERENKIAGIVSLMGNFEWVFPQWIVIKDMKTDTSNESIELVGFDLMAKIFRDCIDGPSTCIHMAEVKQRVDAANAVLAKDQWRPFPCFSGLMQPDRKEPGCEPFFETKTEFEDGRLRVAHRGRLLLDVRKPAWVYRDRYRSCKSMERTALQSEAFDPETGIFVVGLHFWAVIEGCDEPLWDFHPIRLPALRSKPARGRDGGTP